MNPPRRRGRPPQIDPTRRQVVDFELLASLLGLGAAATAPPAGDRLAALVAAGVVGAGAVCRAVNTVNVEAIADEPGMRVVLTTPAVDEDERATLPAGAHVVVTEPGAAAARLSRVLRRAVAELRDPRERRIQPVELRLVVARRLPPMQPYYLISDGAATKTTLRFATWDQLLAAR